ncbi:MAG TPA: hypothetical protein VJT85_01205, partial [Gemmatimonadaceae bacterium]|nr:hypothetical protein [Gemmatimonadaceae bacterium]
MRSDGTFNPFAPGEPARDEELAALLRQAVGDVPDTVDWDALATRITRALPARANVAWWSYAELWSRRILPIALAASLVGAAMLWNADDVGAVVVAQTPPADVVVDVVQGVSIEDAARTFARTMTV